MAKIVMYTKEGCPYCSRARYLLGQKSAQWEEILAAGDPAKRQEMVTKSGGRNTFPQIFIGDKHVGGCDDLFALDAKGALDPLLAG